MRLDRFLAENGAGTRSEVKKHIRKGLVTVNDIVVRTPELHIDADKDRVCLEGVPVRKAPEFLYYILNKPAGYVSASEDRKDPTVVSLLPETGRSLFPVGRLDKNTEGLLLLTDDGDLAHRMLSPAKHVDKTYFARVAGKVTEEDCRRFLEGLEIGEKKKTLPARLKVLSAAEDGADEEISEVEITIHEGKYHQVKRMMEAVGKRVIYLKRLRMGPLFLPGELSPGECRPATEEEISALMEIKRIS